MRIGKQDQAFTAIATSDAESVTRFAAMTCATS
jgi:hypothetical protein